MNTNMVFDRWISLRPYFHSLLRITASIMFILAGTMKLFAYPMGMPPNGDTAELFTQVGIGGILEAFGGLLVLIGFYTRPAAFILCGEMAVAYWQYHAPLGFWPIENGGVAAVLYCFVWLYFSAAGSGRLSLDNWREKMLSKNLEDTIN